MAPIVDLHNHPSLKPYNNKEYRVDVNIWEGMKPDHESYNKLKKKIQQVIHEVARGSQTHLKEWIEGDIQVCLAVLHPAERGWFAKTRDKRAKFRKFLLSLFLPEHHIKYLGAALTGFHVDKVEKIINRIKKPEGIDYFKEETFMEYHYLKENQNVPGPKGYTYKIINNYQEYEIVKTTPKQLGMILSIEGGHALTDISNPDWFYTTFEQLSQVDQDTFKDTLALNINSVKGTNDSKDLNFDHVPFFITVSHMYQNLLAGHAKSYGAGHFIVPGMDDLLDQNAGMDIGFTEAGWFFVDKLLSRKNGRRILLDVKHLSMKARKEYYKFVADRKSYDPIPIIASHAAVNGYDKIDLSRKDTYKLDKRTYLSRWSINLTNEDIREIHASDGIIGLVIHEGRMPGGKTKKRLKKLKKRINRGGKKGRNAENELKTLYCQLIMSNIFQIISVINDESAWDFIGIGSDYDGIMDPFNCYKNISKFQSLMNDIKEALRQKNPIIIYKNDVETEIHKDEINRLMFRLSPDVIVKKLSNENIENFLRTYFTDDYRLS